jgi:dephospho-CoA kinase
MDKTCIVLVGLARSGKDTVADYLKEKHGFAKLVFSDVLVKEARKKNLPETKMVLVGIGDQMRKKYGMDAVAKKTISSVPDSAKKIVFVGARSPQEFDAVKKSFPNAVLVMVRADKEKRFERKSNSDPCDKISFFERDKIDEEKKGLLELLKKATHEIVNDGSLFELKEKTELFLKNIKTV